MWRQPIEYVGAAYIAGYQLRDGRGQPGQVLTESFLYDGDGGYAPYENEPLWTVFDPYYGDPYAKYQESEDSYQNEYMWNAMK